MRSAAFSFACILLYACTPNPVPGATAPASSSGGEASSAFEFGSIEAAINGSHRTAADRARDAARHPRETLEFLGIRPNQRVIELWPGDGWYTELLAPVLHDEGAAIAVVPEGPELSVYLGLLQSHPEIYDRVELVTITPAQPMSFGSEDSADLAFSAGNFHAWLQAGIVDSVLAEVARVLKPGAVYGVIEPRAKPGTSRDLMLQTGYVTEELVIESALKVGLVLEGRSQINANPRDTKDHPAGVWTLPPTLRLGNANRQRYQAIGEPDRMTLRFRKPAIE